jgi:hypothetical protein
MLCVKVNVQFWRQKKKTRGFLAGRNWTTVDWLGFSSPDEVRNPSGLDLILSV